MVQSPIPMPFILRSYVYVVFSSASKVGKMEMYIDYQE